MTERSRFFDDIAGVAGGAFSALAGIREEVEATVRARVDEAIRKLDLVRREDMEAVQDMAANARAGQEAAEVRLKGVEARLTLLEGNSPTKQPDPGASEVAPGTMPTETPAPKPVEDKPSEVTPAALPPGSGSVMPDA